MFELEKSFLRIPSFCSVLLSDPFSGQKLEMMKLVEKFIPPSMKKDQNRSKSSEDALEESRVAAGDRPTESGQKMRTELNLPSEPVELDLPSEPAEMGLPSEPIELGGQVGGSLNLSYC